MAELVRQKFRVLADRARQALEQEGEPFTVLADLLRGNAEQLRRDAGMQQALAGFDEHIWAQAAPEQDELLTLTGELIGRARRAGTIRRDATAWDVAMLMSGVCATMNQSAPGFDYRRHLELILDALRHR